MKAPHVATLICLAAVAVTSVRAQIVGGSSSKNPCVSKQTCRECIQTASCAWCAQPNYNSIDGSPLPRCNYVGQLSSSRLARCEMIYQPENQRRIVINEQFAKATYSREAVQFRPQRVKLSLRVGQSYDLQVSYSQAEDYPVDLYYLMDLSKSMEDDKEKLSSLGDLLADTMQNITSNFRLGFGSFVDKVVMPYVSTVPKKLLEPCDGCKAPYGYRNHMSLSVNTSRFAGEVHHAAVSGNLDAPEGGFDAIMQAIVCRDHVGWREKARRLLVFSTDASFHYAGDGKLGGIVKPNDGLCHLVRDEYTHSTIQDYPSVSQINAKVKEHAINLIFAVTEEQINIYDRLKDSVEGSSAGQLSQDSSNVVELVREQYDKISSSVELKDKNASSVVKISYFSSCLAGGPLKPTNKCDGLKVGNVVNFTAKIEVTKCPENRNEWRQTFEIYPVGISESLIVDLEILCECDCEKKTDKLYQENSPLCSHVGTYQCGICACPPNYFGRKCECDNNNLGVQQDLEAGCRPNNLTADLCYNQGSCVCGVCDCYTRPNPEEVISGQYCECDNFTCERHNLELCSGKDHGTCQCGRCVCNEGWTGPACACPDSDAACIPPGGGEPCMGQGTCECGICKCHQSDEARYSGTYCEACPTCPGHCNELRPCVQCLQFQSGELYAEDKCANCTEFTPIEVDVVQDFVNDTHALCSAFDEDDCRFLFVYTYDKGKPVVYVQKTKECPPEIDVLGIVLGVIGAIVFVGLAFLLLWKLFTTIHDRREFAKFEKERRMAKWDTGENPIYKQATSTFKNPTYGGK